MDKELQKHKTGDTVKWILTLLAFILIGVMLTGIILGWFDKTAVPEQNEEQQTQVNNFGIDEIHNTKTMSLAVSTYAATSTSESYTIKATVSPSTAVNKNVDWSAEFVNSTSAWASGKNASSYIKITPSGTNNATATVTCLQAFGEQIKVIAKSNENASISAYCVCDYYERINSVTGDFTGLGAFDTAQQINEWSYTSGGKISGNGGDLSLNSIMLSYSASKSAGTIAESLHDMEVTLTPTPEFVTAMKAKDSSYASAPVTFTANNGSIARDVPLNYGSGCYFPLTGMTSLSDNLGDPIYMEMLSYDAMRVLCDNPDMCFMSVTIKINGDNNDFVSTFKVKAKRSTLPLKVTNLTVDNSTLKF
jgi:hypothetical protein